MKNVWKISRHYVLSAILLTVLVLYANIAAFVAIGIKYVNPVERNAIGREIMENVSREIAVTETECVISDEGVQMLEQSSFVWAMLLDDAGDVQWSWQLPQDFSQHYTIGEISAFSRWYLNDYPVRTWKMDEGLMVYGMEKDSVIRYDLIYDSEALYQMPHIVKILLLVNGALMLALAFLFAYRFYRSIRPVVDGIGQLADKKPVHLQERGITAELAQKLNQASEIIMSQHAALERRDMARTEWIAGVSHDIRTPLALIVGYADELAKEPGMSENGCKRAEQIQNLSLVISQLIADLNLTSKLEYQAQPLRKSEFSPAGLLRECVVEYYNQGLSDAYEIEVEAEPDVEQVTLNGDTGLILRAFRNLIGNSIRHNPEGCVVSVQLTKTEDGVAYLFTDTGEGIPAQVVNVILEKESKPTADAQPVHIMGMRIVMQIIKAHGGAVKYVQRENGNYDTQIFL